MKKTRTRRFLTWFLVLMMLVSLAPTVSAASLTALSKTVTGTPNEKGELDITLTVSGETVTQNQPLNLLLVIDLSNSMNNILSGRTTRLQALKNAFAGSTNNFIDSLQAKVGSENLFVDIVAFDSIAYNKLPWTNNMETVKSTINGLQVRNGAPNDYKRGGTNYEDALAKAQEAAASESDVHVIFLSDGLPTYYGANGTSSNGDSCSVTNLTKTLSQMELYQKDSNITFRAAIAYATTPTFTTDGDSQGSTIYRYDNVSLLGPASSNVSGTYQKYEKIEEHWWGDRYDWVDDPSQNLGNRSIHTIGYNAYAAANSESDLLKSLNAIVKGFNLSSVKITDPMHKTHIQEDIDLESLSEEKLKVYLVNENGTETLLTSPSDYTVTGSTINYIPELKAGQTLKVVATVKVSDTPGEDYFTKQQYPDSDGKSGYLSNQEAKASGTVNDEPYSGTYSNPVFQLNTTRLTIRKVSSADNSQNLSGAAFTITRKASSDSDAGVIRNQTYTTGKDGTLIIPNLPYGYYELTETASPAGFKILETPLTFTVDYLGQITSTDERLQSRTGSANEGYTATVTNDPNDVTLTVKKNLEGTAKNADDTFPFELSAEGVNTVSDSIGQDGTITITVPYDTEVTVAEKDSRGYTATVDTEEGQTAAITNWASSGNGYSGTITLTENTSITITNTKDAPVVTSFVTDNSGMTGITLVSVTLIGLGAVAIYLKKRHF